MSSLSFGKGVYQQRAAFKLTQKEFAAKVGISRRQLQLIEAGKVNPTTWAARKIKGACGCSWADLLG
jgi:DNA-binding XRE family transcriptional regulator